MPSGFDTGIFFEPFPPEPSGEVADWLAYLSDWGNFFPERKVTPFPRVTKPRYDVDRAAGCGWGSELHDGHFRGDQCQGPQGLLLYAIYNKKDPRLSQLCFLCHIFTVTHIKLCLDTRWYVQHRFYIDGFQLASDLFWFYSMNIAHNLPLRKCIEMKHKWAVYWLMCQIG